jgi:hypothetical protein
MTPLDHLRPWRQALVALAGDLGLEGHTPPRWAFRLDGLTGHAEVHRNDDRLHVWLPLTNPDWAQLTILDRRRTLGESGALETGDAALSTLVIFGPIEALGLFDVAARHTWRTLVDAGVTLEGGTLHLHPPAHPTTDDHARDTLRRLFAEANRLASTSLVQARNTLFLLAATDPNREVRQCLTTAAETKDLVQHAIERRLSLNDDALETETMLVHLHSDTLPPNVRNLALRSLLTRVTLPDLEALTAVDWAELDEPDTLVHLGQALAKTPHHAKSALVLFGRILRAPDAWRRVPEPLVDALLDHLPAPCGAGVTALMLLLRHEDRAVAMRVADALSEKLPHHPLPLEELAKPLYLDLAARSPPVTNALAQRLEAHFEAADLTPSDEAAGRKIARFFVMRMNPGLILDAALNTPNPTGRRSFIEALVRSHRRGRDDAGLPIIQQLIDLDDPSLRQLGMSALMDLSDEVQPAFRHVPVDALIRAALDGRTRFGAAHLRHRIERTFELDRLLALLGALRSVATRNDIPTYLWLLDNQPDPVVIAALGGLGEVGTLAELPKIEDLTSGLFRDRDIKAAARAAADSIRRRNIDRGALSLAADGGGLALGDEPPR